jgi:hypothetical protein
VAYDLERNIGVYFHRNMTQLEERPLFVVCPFGEDRPIFRFWASHAEAIDKANQKYAAWLKRKH